MYVFLACHSLARIYGMAKCHQPLLVDGDGAIYSVYIYTTGKCRRLLSAVHQGHRGSPSPTCCKNHVPRPPLPLVSPRSGNRVNPLEGPQSVSGSGEAHTKERNTPISPSPITNTTPPSPICRIVMFPWPPLLSPLPSSSGL